MGNHHRFSLSDMMPNAWFYKLKEMGKKSRGNHNICNKKHHSQPTSSSSSYSSTSASAKITTQSHHRKSYYFTRDLNSPLLPPEPPRKSTKKRRSTTTKRRSSSSSRTATSSVSAGCSCRASMESVWTKPEEYPDSPLDSTSHSSNQEPPLPELPAAATPETFDGMLSLSTSEHALQTVSRIDLPPIITKPNNKFNESVNVSEKFGYSVKKSNDIPTKSGKQSMFSVRRYSGNSPGLKLRTNSPRIGNRRIQGRRSAASASASLNMPESFAVVKSSKDPQRDFRESMVEMIVENNIRASKDLENLLACYLSLNSNEYHDLIVKVFKQIWFDITTVRFK